MHPDGSPENIKRSVENCLTLLDGKKSIDIFEPARIDKKTPLETTLKALEAYVKAGELGGISLSEVSAVSLLPKAIVLGLTFKDYDSESCSDHQDCSR